MKRLKSLIREFMQKSQFRAQSQCVRVVFRRLTAVAKLTTPGELVRDVYNAAYSSRLCCLKSIARNAS